MKIQCWRLLPHPLKTQNLRVGWWSSTILGFSIDNFNGQHSRLSIIFLREDCQPLLGSPGARQELTRSGLNLRPLQREETSKPLSGLTECDQFVKIDQTVSRPVFA
uniref:Uncharacterized protein n=1 Tax=Vitis vinifera TaxID=29760 RepID=F6HWR4_VITVI